MIDKQIKLNKKQKAVIEPYVQGMKEGEMMMRSGAKLKEEADKNLWKVLRKITPELDNGEHCSIHLETLTVSYLQASAKLIFLRAAKEQAISNQDFELAADYRDKEKAEVRRLK